MDWCNRLWSQPFDHPDPVHNPPSADELATLSRVTEAIEAGLKDSREGRTVPLEEARRRFGLGQS
jgi:serine/threonine protein kinase HipA of HipAB toxin-antitoxin module